LEEEVEENRDFGVEKDGSGATSHLRRPDIQELRQMDEGEEKSNQY